MGLLRLQKRWGEFTPGYFTREGKPHGGKQTCAKLPANETLVGDNAKEEGEILWWHSNLFYFNVFEANRQKSRLFEEFQQTFHFLTFVLVSEVLNYCFSLWYVEIRAHSNNTCHFFGIFLTPSPPPRSVILHIFFSAF